MTPDTTMPARYHDGFGGHYYASTVACAVGSEFQTMDEALDDFVERLGQVDEATVYFAAADRVSAFQKYTEGADLLAGAGLYVHKIKVEEREKSVAYMVRFHRKSIPAALSPRGDGPSDRGRPSSPPPVATMHIGPIGLIPLCLLLLVLTAGAVLAWRAW